MTCLLLDVRTRQEYAQGHVPGALLLETPLPPLTTAARHTLAQRLYVIVRGFPRAMCILLYCKKGKRAGLAQRMLFQWGYYNAHSLGGVETNPALAKVATRKHHTR